MTGTEGFMSHGGFRTWYRVVGEPTEGTAPLVICHGGPGLTHDYVASVADLAATGRPCVLYDQVGCGRSDRRPDADPSLWTVDLFVRELTALVEHLGIADGYHLFGHSWGGMLALEQATLRPAGLRSLVVANTFASSATYTAHVVELLAELPEEHRAAVERHEATGTTDAPEYQDAVRVFFGKHGCRARPIPDDLRRTLGALAEDSTVYQAMNGPSEFALSGSLRDWRITDRLADIDVPVLLLSGQYDEVRPAVVDELYQGLKDPSWVVFENSSHMPHLEEHDRFIEVVADFLAGTRP